MLVPRLGIRIDEGSRSNTPQRDRIQVARLIVPCKAPLSSVTDENNFLEEIQIHELRGSGSSRF